MSIYVFLLLSALSLSFAALNEEIAASDYLNYVNAELARRTNIQTEINWEYNTNITPENERKKNDIAVEEAKFTKKVVEEIKKFNTSLIKSADVLRQLKLLSDLDYAALPEAEYARLQDVLTFMESNYAKAHVCDYKTPTKCDLSLEPDVEEVFMTSRDPKELAHYWEQWYKQAGTQVRSEFMEYVALNTKAAKLNGYRSGAEMWLKEYEDDTFEQQLEDLFERLKPLYQNIHGYVRHKLNKYYGDEVLNKTGPIPMHLLGNMWAQQWSSIADIVAPFPNKPSIDVSQEMVKQGITPLKMFEMGDDFFTSMGLIKLPPAFWEKSLIEKPNDGRELVCHASAWDFWLKDDVRIKMCTRVNQEQLSTVHHELGHVQYFLQYQHLPFIYRNGANPGFHEAVGDVLSLSVSTPRHLQAIGLLKNYQQDNEARINQLFLTALDKIVFLPFAYTLDKYRWAVFRGEVDKNNMNCAFWKLRSDYSGIEPPVVRTEKDFDPPAKYHVSADVEYLRYMVSFIIQFEFYKTACIKAGQYDPTNPELPLDNCDIYGSKEAGDALHNMLSLGASKPWPDVLEAFNGKRTMTADALVEYFSPLQKFLEEENKKNNVYIGWEPSNKCVAN